LRLQVARDEKERREMGQRIKEMRAARNLKQQVIADKVGVTLRQYQNWQAGENTPESDHLDKLAEVLDVTPEWLLRGATPDPFSRSQQDAAALLEQIAEQVNELHALLLGDGPDEEVVAGIAARLLPEDASPPQPTAGRSQTPPATRRRKSA
jgi:transcriptional regulator with XRE-family HTH domain